MSPETLSSLEAQRLAVAKILFDADCVDLNFKKGHTFSSGIQSPIKIDCEKLADPPKNFQETVSKLEQVIKSTFGDYRFLCGVIKGGVPFAEELAERFRVKTVCRLGIKQNPARVKMVTGTIGRNEKGIIIEDVLTTGKNIELCAQQIDQEGGFHLGAVVIFDYGFKKAQDNIWKHGLRRWTLTTFTQLLTFGQETSKFTKEDVARLEDWWEETNRHLQEQPEPIKIK